MLAQTLYEAHGWRVEWGRFDGNLVVSRWDDQREEWERLGAVHALDLARQVEAAEADRAATAVGRSWLLVQSNRRRQ